MGETLTSLSTLTSVSRADSSVDLDVLAREPLSKILDFLQAFRHELLASVTRSHGHDEEEVGGVAESLGDDGGRGFGGDGETGFEVVRVDEVDHVLVVFCASGWATFPPREKGGQEIELDLRGEPDAEVGSRRTGRFVVEGV